MRKNELKWVSALMATVFVPLLAYSDQPMNNMNAYQQSAAQQPGYEAGEMVRSGQMPAGYNQTASYVCDNNWDIFVTADYIYWAWNQSTLQLGTITTQSTGTSTDTVYTNDAIFQSPGYTSGFQTGMGFNMKGMDNWSIYSEYTWYKNTDDQDFTGTSVNPIVLNSSQFRADSFTSTTHIEGTLTSKVKMGFQALDFLAQRPFYFGKKLTAAFSTGLRAQWISQKYTKTSPLLTDVNTGTTLDDIESIAKQTSWSLGPKFALNSSWLLGYGIKMLGNIAQSALYTSYNTSNSYNYIRSNGTSSSDSYLGLQNYGTISPVTEAFLGLAWGSYFSNDNFHIDLSIGYDFNIYWNYNMAYTAYSQTEGNMYLQGMNAQLRLDF